MTPTKLTHKRLLEVLHYDPSTGEFTSIVNRCRAKAGSSPGKIDYYGYRAIQIDGNLYKAHRLAWLYCFGEWPKDCIDHIDGNRQNNAIGNLRDVSRSINQQNFRGPRTDNTSGFLGVYLDKRRNKFVARIFVEGRHVHIGAFDSAPDAGAAYLMAKRRLHDGCTI